MWRAGMVGNPGFAQGWVIFTQNSLPYHDLFRLPSSLYVGKLMKIRLSVFLIVNAIVMSELAASA
jgi:hypothetical protein